jgi:hypothetical protein
LLLRIVLIYHWGLRDELAVEADLGVAVGLAQLQSATGIHRNPGVLALQRKMHMRSVFSVNNGKRRTQVKCEKHRYLDGKPGKDYGLPERLLGADGDFSAVSLQEEDHKTLCRVE